MKVLIVDDNPSIRNMITTFMALEDGIETETAENGAIALSKYETFKPDVVILDISMPVMDGIEALTQLRKKDPNAAVIMATASGSAANIEECMKKGARAHVEKPFSPDELLATIKNVLKTGTDYDKFTTLFSRIANKMESSLRKMTEVPLTLTLGDIVEVAGKEYEKAVTYSGKDMSQVKRAGDYNERTIEIPDDSVGITAQVEGQRNGIIVASINKQKLRDIVTGQENAAPIEDEDSAFMELFNILNNNQLTEFANYTEQNLRLTAPRYFDKEKDSKVSDKQFVHVIYEIKWNDNKIPLDIFTALSA